MRHDFKVHKIHYKYLSFDQFFHHYFKLIGSDTCVYRLSGRLPHTEGMSYADLQVIIRLISCQILQYITYTSSVMRMRRLKVEYKMEFDNESHRYCQTKQ